MRLTTAKLKNSFTLIELLIVIAILGILASAVMVAINPGKRLKQARDSERKTHISNLANSLVEYYATYGYYPSETANADGCDTSIGAGGIQFFCPPNSNPPDNGWDDNLQCASCILNQLVYSKGLLKRLPVDPVNDITYFYKYEPRASQSNHDCVTFGNCQQYWIGTRLEAPADPSKPVFRCSDYSNLTDGPGCKEVGPNSLMDAPAYNPTN